jgi:polyketide synthase PksM
VAVIGMSGQFPGASDVAGFWQNLLDGRDSISDLPAHYLEPMPGDSTPGQAPECLRGGYLENRARFDPLFFNLSPREAEAMNPHQRLILQEGWRSLEDAGYNPKSLADSKVAVYIGAELSRYGNASFTGSSEALVASRLSYYLDLKGPAMVINTGCSSSGTAIHLACESLRHGEACMALAGGVFAALDREMIATVGRAGMVSRKGRCNTFDAGADGTVFAEAVGVVVLKRLEDALRDSDHIYGVIQGSGVNQDGTSNGITAPNGAAQEALLADVYRRFNVEPAEIGYVEVHGTGTALGDPVEGNALVRAFGAFTDRQHYCAVGSAKSHIGHTAAASAVVGLIKLLLSLKHGLIPRMPHFERLNPLIEFDRSPFYVNPERVAWESPGGGLRMGALSSFGHGGTNVHLVVREHPIPARGRRDMERQPRELVVLSARNSERLMESAQKLREFLLKTPPDLGDLAYTLQVGREAMEERVAFETNGIAECVARLEEIGEGRIPERKSWRGSVGDGRKSAAAREQCSGTAGLDEIAECWVNGGEVDWRLLRRDEVPRRVSLPSYPFALEYHWLTRTDVAARAPAATQAREEEAFELLCFEETWCTSELVPPTRKGECARKTVLCFLSGAEAQRAVRDEMSLLHPETRVVFAAVSDGYRRDSADTYRVAVDDPESYGQLFRTVRAESESGAIDDILYLWALEDQAYIRDTAPIVTILQQAADAQLRPKRVLLAGTYGPDLDRCYLESWIGFERSLRLVWPQTEVRVVVQENGAAAGSDLVKRVVAELEAGEARSVLYKNTERREPGMVSRTLSGAESAIPQEGSILIAGGLGGLGAIFAEHLARTRGLNLILTGRSGLDRVKQARIEKLRTLGSAAIYVQADICDETAMRRGIETAKHRFGEISGVIHAAGVSSGLSIFQKDHKAFQSVLGPKVTGTVVLDRLLAEDPLRFVCYFSSTAAVLGDFGACDYAVGNRFQMAYASHREELRAQGTRSGKTVVINWPLWRDGGMGVGDEEQQAFYLKSSGQRALEAEEGLSTFERIMRADGVQHIVLVGKPSRVVRFLKQGHATALAPSGAAHHDAEEFAGWGGARERLVAELRSLVSQHLKVPENLLNEDKNLAEVGLDSILLAELAQRLSQRYATEITPAILFGHPSLGKLARHFWEDHQDLVRRHYSAPPEASLPVAAPVSSRPRRGCRGVKEEPIAIIGMSGRFAQADSVAELWARVKRSASCISEVPDERWFWRSAERVRGGFIRGVDRFDPLFFAIAPRDANAMDPGQRLFLEEAWHTFEDAGYMGARIRGTSCGVFVGVEESEYRVLTGARSIDGNQNATLAARIAYALDLKGPNFALTASCSSGLVAVHQACLALRQQDCELALAGGVSLMLSPANHQALLAAGMLSPDGVCRVFDGRANGLVPGEAVAAVLLKPLNKALRDGDRVYACITGSGINYDGASNGITAPNYVSQSELLANTYDRHGIDPADIQFVMAHSVGSSLTDPVEVEALTTAFRKYSSETGYCHLGSIKPLIGHTFAASGVVGLIGVVMAMRDRIIPGTQGYERANSALRLEGSPFVLSAQNTDWTSQDGRPRVGAVSTAGISGTNAHIVIEEHVETEDRTTQRPAPSPQLAVLSARNRERLMAVADQMVRFLETNPDISLPDLCYTLQVGRDPMPERWAAVVGSVEQLIQGMRGFVAPAATSEGQPAHDGPTSAALEGLRDAWLDGAVVPFERLHAGRSPRIVSLPTYPFVRRSCWIRQGAEPHHGDLAPSGNKVVDLYSYLAKDKTAEYQMEYLTFFPFTKRIPGFSMTRVALNPERYPDEVALIKARQIELRQVLFCREDFSAMQSVLDFGCGHGTDVIQMASQYPHIHVHGITITPAQAELGRSRIERLGLSPRAAIFNQDSAKNSFPGRYDMVFGIEVACHIQDKQSLFQNIVSSLKEGGRVLLMEFIANLRGPIADPNVSVYIPTRENWAELLAEHGLVIDENVDVTAEIANGQYDPEFEQNTKDLPEVVRASWRNYANNSIAMSKGWVGYSLFRLYVDRRLCFAGRKAHNARKLADETPYRDALEQTLRRGSPYPGAEDQRAVMGSSLGEGR